MLLHQFILTSSQIEECEKFSQEIQVNYYNSRNQNNEKKKREDQKIAKYGEIGSYLFLKSNHVDDISYPDFKVYGHKEKTWDYDLKSDQFNFHIKSQSDKSAKKYGSSWIFQKEDKKIFKEFKDNDRLILTQVNLKDHSVIIKGVIPIIDLHQGDLFKEPKVFQLRSKLALYYDDLEKRGIELWKM